MSRFFLITMLLIAGVKFANAQEVVYDANAEERKVAPFTAIEVSGTISLYLAQGSQTGIAVSAGEEKYNSKIKTEVKNGVLSISVDAGMWNGFSWSNKKLKAYVSVVDLTRLEVSGASFVNISGSLKANSLKLGISGASEIRGDVAVDNLNAQVSGASVVKLAGKAENATIDASGAGRVNCFDLAVNKGNLEASGASHIAVTVNKEFVVNASGGSTIQYKGNPEVKTLNTSAGASVKNKNE